MNNASPAYTLHLKFSEKLVRASVWASWEKVFGWKAILGWSLTVLGLIIAYYNGIDPFIAGLFLGCLSLTAIFAVAVYCYTLKAALRKFREMEKPEAVLELFDEGLTFTTSNSSATLKWSLIKEIRKFPEFWLLYYTKASCSSLDLSYVPPAAQAYLVEKIGMEKVRS